MIKKKIALAVTHLTTLRGETSFAIFHTLLGIAVGAGLAAISKRLESNTDRSIKIVISAPNRIK